MSNAPTASPPPPPAQGLGGEGCVLVSAEGAGLGSLRTFSQVSGQDQNCHRHSVQAGSRIPTFSGNILREGGPRRKVPHLHSVSHNPQFSRRADREKSPRKPTLSTRFSSDGEINGQL